MNSFRTLDGVIIKKVGISVGLNTSKKVEGFYIDLDQKKCVNSVLLKRKFGFLIPDFIYFHPMPNTPIIFHTTDEWGDFVMGETRDFPGCATNIGIGMFNSKKEQQEWIEYVRKQVAFIKKKD